VERSEGRREKERDIMRTTSCLVAALVAAGSGSALADIVIDGGASWSGWSSVASSQTSGV
jgi:hypothetical protein